VTVSPDLWTVQAESVAPLATVQLRQYHFPTPNEVVEDEARPILSFAFPRMHGREGRGRFLYGSKSLSGLGPVILRPPANPFYAYGVGGPSRILTCDYDKVAFEQLTELSDWDDGRLRRCVDIRSPGIGRAMRRIAQELERPGFGSDILVESLAQSILIDLARWFHMATGRESVSQGGLAAWQVKRVKDMLNGSVGGWPTIAGLAEACGISRCHLSRSFRQATGSTLVDYSAMVRMLRAKTLLSEGLMAVGDVAKRVGFRSTSSFSTAFRRETGTSPARFIQMRRGNGSLPDDMPLP